MKAHGHAKLLSSCEGSIKSILLVHPGFTTEAGDMEYEAIERIFREKGCDIYRFRQEHPHFKLKYSKLRDDSEALKQRTKFRETFNLYPGIEIEYVLSSWRRELKELNEGRVLTFRRWAQDPFLVLQKGEWTILLDSLHNRRLCDFFLPLEIAQQTDPHFVVRPTRLYIEGGNVLRGIKGVFIGEDLVHENMQLLSLERAKVLEDFSKTFGGVDIIPVKMRSQRRRLRLDGGKGDLTRQPLFHIDLLMSLGGRIEEDSQEVIFYSDPIITSQLLENIKDKRSFHSNLEDDIEIRFREPAESLAAIGFHVICVPVFFYDNVLYSWTNCLIETQDKRKRVILPSYQAEYDPEKLNTVFEILEKEVASTYTNAGMEVVWIEAGRMFRNLARQGGSLHCAVKVLRRG